MKTLKITLMLALFVVVSSQTDQSSLENLTTNEIKKQESAKTYYDLLAHSKDKIRFPSQS